MIYTCENKYVVKIYEDIKHTKAMISLHNFLISSEIYVPKIITSLNGKQYTTLVKNKYIVVFSFLKGEHLTWNKEQCNLDENTVTAIAKTLRKMHNVTTDNNMFELPNLPFENNLKRNSVLHFDLTKDNIFIDKEQNNKIGFIDFDDAKYGASVCDLAIAVATLFFTKKAGAKIKLARKFINEYYGDELELKSEELPLLKDFALKWIDYILDGNEFDTSTKESFEIKRKLISIFL
jgi:Ser/Thr protein kinase RdoA (MazF antagonist)